MHVFEIKFKSYKKASMKHNFPFYKCLLYCFSFLCEGKVLRLSETQPDWKSIVIRRFGLMKDGKLEKIENLGLVHAYLHT